MTDITLSDEQLQAVEADEQAIVLVAGPGSGKTEVVARRVERLLAASPGDEFRVLAITYTIRAADELRHRFDARLGALSHRVDADTIHGFAHRLLRQHGTRIGLPVEPELLSRDDDRAELLNRWLEAEGERSPPDLRETFAAFDLARARLEPAPGLDAWVAALDDARALDFPALLAKATELLLLPSARRQLTRLYGHVVVDEAQNMTAAQYQLLTGLIGRDVGGPEVPTMLVGDEKQSIVSFAGADPALIARFEREFGAQRYELRRNFRSADRIVALASVVAADLNVGPAAGADQAVYPARGLIDVQTLEDEASEAAAVATWVTSLVGHGLPSTALAPGEPANVTPSDIAVLARAAAGLRRIDEALKGTGHPTAVAAAPTEWLATPTGQLVLDLIAHKAAPDHLSTRWALAKALGCTEDQLLTEDDLGDVLRRHADCQVAALSRMVELDHPAGLASVLRDFASPVEQPDGDVLDQAVADWDADVDLFDAAWQRFCELTPVTERTWGAFRLFLTRLQRGDDLQQGVRLLTIHKAQGREYRAVAVIGCNDGQLPDFRAKTAEERTSELKTFYVAITRAARVLLLTRARSRSTRFGPRAAAPSPFLAYVDQIANGV